MSSSNRAYFRPHSRAALVGPFGWPGRLFPWSSVFKFLIIQIFYHRSPPTIFISWAGSLFRLFVRGFRLILGAHSRPTQGGPFWWVKSPFSKRYCLKFLYYLNFPRACFWGGWSAHLLEALSFILAMFKLSLKKIIGDRPRFSRCLIGPRNRPYVRRFAKL